MGGFSSFPATSSLFHRTCLAMEAHRNHGFESETEGSWAKEVAQTKRSPKERGLGEVEEAHYPVKSREDGEAVTILGIGDFGRALAGTLRQAGCRVTVASREPERNRALCPDGASQAEYLASLFPSSTVVKAFNELSACSLESGGLQGSKQVPIAGETKAARDRVASLVTACGFTPLDLGELQAARTIEDIPVAVFP